MTTIIDTVIFDLGGVLIDWEPKRLYKKIFDDQKEMDYFLSEICTPDWNEQQDAGRPLELATNILLEKHPEYNAEILAFYDRWEEMLGGTIEGTVNILKEIKSKESYKVVALTNWSGETFPIALERFEFLQLFEGILVSGDEKMKKPDPKIYQLLLDRYNIHPSNAVFIDDNLRNVKAAIDCKIHGIHFNSPEQCRKELEQLGVL